MVVSMRGDLGEWNAAQVPMGRAVRAILEAIDIPHMTAESPETTADAVRSAGTRAFGTRLPGACLLPRRLTTSVPVRDLRPPQEPPSPSGTSVPTGGDGGRWRGRR